MTMEVGPRSVDVETSVLRVNDEIAEANRKRFTEAGVVVIDVMGSPGAGKTALLEATVKRFEGQLRCGVITGDVATTLDADRISALGVPAVQITTGVFGADCHLDAKRVAQAAGHLKLDRLDVLFVENVGNLVCPTEFDVGRSARVLVISVPEGEDKPLKYPLAFRSADAIVISKVDLSPHLRSSVNALRINIERINPQAALIELSAQTGQGMVSWLGWVQKTRLGRER